MDENLLKNNIHTFLQSAELVFENKDFTSATILYFKALFSLLDLIILQITGRMPKDHSERFRLLENNRKDLYQTLDTLYPLYRDTYTAVIKKEDCLTIKKNVEGIIKKERIFENY
ncbi:MAG: hypothetical protein AABX16_05255 [Nanoarchaeota archaeon]